jgi:hypothetical protein
MTNVWKSSVTTGMTKHLTEQELSDLIVKLDDVVMMVCESYEIGA